MASHGLYHESFLCVWLHGTYYNNHTPRSWLVYIILYTQGQAKLIHTVAYLGCLVWYGTLYKKRFDTTKSS